MGEKPISKTTPAPVERDWALELRTSPGRWFPSFVRNTEPGKLKVVTAGVEFLTEAIVILLRFSGVAPNLVVKLIRRLDVPDIPGPDHTGVDGFLDGLGRHGPCEVSSPSERFLPEGPRSQGLELFPLLFRERHHVSATVLP